MFTLTINGENGKLLFFGRIGIVIEIKRKHQKTPSAPFLLNTGKGSLRGKQISLPCLKLSIRPVVSQAPLFRGKRAVSLKECIGTRTRRSWHFAADSQTKKKQTQLGRRHGSGSSCKRRWVEETAVYNWIRH